MLAMAWVQKSKALVHKGCTLRRCSRRNNLIANHKCFDNTRSRDRHHQCTPQCRDSEHSKSVGRRTHTRQDQCRRPPLTHRLYTCQCAHNASTSSHRQTFGCNQSIRRRTVAHFASCSWQRRSARRLDIVHCFEIPILRYQQREQRNRTPAHKSDRVLFQRSQLRFEVSLNIVVVPKSRQSLKGTTTMKKSSLQRNGGNQSSFRNDPSSCLQFASISNLFALILIHSSDRRPRPPRPAQTRCFR